MFSNQSYQAQIIRDELSRRRKKSWIKVKTQKSLSKTIKEKAKNYITLFLETSSIHGLGHFVAAKRHPCESLLWLAIVIMSVFGAVYLSWTTWMRYQSSPTVVSMDRDMFAWNTTFPCITICPDLKYDQAKLDLYVSNSDIEDKKGLQEFIKALANVTYKNLDSIPSFNGIPPEDYIDVLLAVSSPFKPQLTIGAAGISREVEVIITEMGLCFAINSDLAIYSSPEYRKSNRWDVKAIRNDTFFIHPLDGEVFATLVNITSSYNVYIHGPLEVPDISTKFEHSEESFYMKIYVTVMAVYTSPEAAKLSVDQRRCRFLHENNLNHNPVYTYNMCRMECRIRLCLEHCQCVPHFYKPKGDEKICDAKGLQCLAKWKEELYTLISDGKRVECGCLPNCDDVNYVIQSSLLQPWFLGTNLQWGVVTYPRMRFRRDIIFGFTDVLVAVGGMAGLFLGCSVLSFMEIVYFLTLRLICYTHASIKK